MTGEIIPFGGEKARIIHDLGRNPKVDALLSAARLFRANGWDFRPLAALAKQASWSSLEKDTDAFASFLAEVQIEFEERAIHNAQASDVEQQAAKELVAAVKEQTSYPERFWRARRMSALIGNTLGARDPIRIIEQHLQLFFDAARRPPQSLPTVSSTSSEYQFLRTLAENLADGRPKSEKVRAILYFLSHPHDDADRFSSADVRSFRQLGAPYDDLAFTRFTFPCEDRLDPMTSRWGDLEWLYEHARTPQQMHRLVTAVFELRDELPYRPGGATAATISNFFERVRNQQEIHGGVSLWNESTATSLVHWFYWFTHAEDVKIDFISRLCGTGQEHYEPEYPDFNQWSALVHEARDSGYLELAQALTGYKLLDEILFAGRITSWPSLSNLLAEYSRLRYFEITANCARVAADTLASRSQPALAKRLEAYASSGPAVSDKVIRLVREGSTRPRSSEEIEIRLIEHLGRHNWEKLKPLTKTWLIEADLNWSQWRFADKSEHERKDWSAPALQFCKAVEYELVGAYGKLCVAAKDADPSGKVTLGNVVWFLQHAARGERTRTRLLDEARRPHPSKDVIQALQQLVSSYRNLAAHPSEFDSNWLDSLRGFLFSERILRRLIEQLLPPSDPSTG